MTHSYQPLPLHRLESATGYFRPRQKIPKRVATDDPAVSIMTDLGRITAFTIELSAPLSKGLETMVKQAIRILLVCDADGNLIGVLTSRDIDGDKPNRILAKAGGVWEDLLVADVMTLRPKLEVLRMEDVLRARVGDIIATLRQVNRQHALVLDHDPETGKSGIRGIFSLSQIALRLGLKVDPARRPITFVELEQAGVDL